MYQKVKNFVRQGYEENTLRWILMWCGIAAILVIILLTAFGRWKSNYHYPENTYQHLEAEAERIIQEQDLNSKYELEITSFNNKTNKLEFILSAKEESSTAKITVIVKNYQQENQKINISREYNSAFNNSLVETIRLIILTLFLAGFMASMVWLYNQFKDLKTQ